MRNKIVFQSTLPQGERHTSGHVKPIKFRISIHAPTRGATCCRCEDAALCQISIHAPTRGATDRLVRAAIESLNFNPRSHKGSDAVKCLADIWEQTFQSTLPQGERQQFYTKFHICFISFLPILSPYHISTHSPLPTFNHFLYIFSGANRPGISCLLPFRTKTISGIL